MITDKNNLIINNYDKQINKKSYLQIFCKIELLIVTDDLAKQLTYIIKIKPPKGKIKHYLYFKFLFIYFKLLQKFATIYTHIYNIK